MRNLEIDKKIVYDMATESARHVIISAFEYGTIHEFGERSGIMNDLNYGTIINRLQKALNQLWVEDRCEKNKEGRGYSYDFTQSLGKEY